MGNNQLFVNKVNMSAELELQVQDANNVQEPLQEGETVQVEVVVEVDANANADADVEPNVNIVVEGGGNVEGNTATVKAVQVRERSCCESFLACILPPVFACLRGHSVCQVVVSVLLTLLGIIPGIIWSLVCDGVACCNAVLMALIPTLGLYCSTKKCNCDIVICLLLGLTYFGGVWWAIWKSQY